MSVLKHLVQLNDIRVLNFVIGAGKVMCAPWLIPRQADLFFLLQAK